MKNFAFVDVETTGASAMHDRVIDIGIVKVIDGKIVETFSSVIDPETYVPPTIQSLTGITQAEIERAPTFHTLAEKIQDLLSGATFVAHNARFDYAFIKQEFDRAGIKFQAKCLCTVKLSRRLFPEYRKHDLSTLIERFDFHCDARHRALPDAQVLVDFLKLCEQKFGQDVCQEAYKTVMKRNALPTRISHELIDSLPETPGVYIFYGEDGETLYIGKSINIRGRVLSHFADDHRSGKEMRMSQEVADIEAIETSGELSALLLESHLIKERQPLYNRMSRYSRELVFVKESFTKLGYSSFTIERLVDFQGIKPHESIGMYKSIKHAKKALNDYAREYNLCPVLLGIEKSDRGCFFSQVGICKGACLHKESPEAYNARVRQAFAQKRIKDWPYNGPVMVKEEKNQTEGTYFIVNDWRLIGSVVYDEAGKREFLPGTFQFDHDAYKILARQLAKRHLQPVTKAELSRLLEQESVVQAIDF
jgi:DNA polymerase-3 subunit epsilon